MLLLSGLFFPQVLRPYLCPWSRRRAQQVLSDVSMMFVSWSLDANIGVFADFGVLFATPVASSHLVGPQVLVPSLEWIQVYRL
jgi:hypothetical protein